MHSNAVQLIKHSNKVQLFAIINSRNFLHIKM